MFNLIQTRRKLITWLRKNEKVFYVTYSIANLLMFLCTIKYNDGVKGCTSKNKLGDDI